MHRKFPKVSLIREYFTLISDSTVLIIDQIFESIYFYVEIPLQNACYYFGILSLCKSRYGQSWISLKTLSELLTESYFWTFFIYFLILFLAPIYSRNLQQYFFLDPLLSVNRQCIDIQFVRINEKHSNEKFIHLNENFIENNRIIKNKSKENYHYNSTKINELFNLLNNYHWIICQRSLYLHARFQSYASLLHSKNSYYQFYLTKYSRTFFIDQPPFIDLCLHSFNRTHSQQIQSQLRSLSSYSYSSINLFLFDFNFTQITVTLYELNSESNHLERTSIHTGWLHDLYTQYLSFKYQDALSTVLFDGYGFEQQFIDYFNYTHIPLPADSLLGLNEMVQQALIILPLC